MPGRRDSRSQKNTRSFEGDAREELLGDIGLFCNITDWSEKYLEEIGIPQSSVEMMSTAKLYDIVNNDETIAWVLEGCLIIV